jgi:hypothetical protein
LDSAASVMMVEDNTRLPPRVNISLKNPGFRWFAKNLAKLEKIIDKDA